MSPRLLSLGSIALCVLPVACLALACAAIRRPEARLDAVTNGRVITDSRGQEIRLSEPFRGTALLFPPTMGEYFVVTNAPESVVALTTISPALLHHSLLSSCVARLPQLAAERMFPTPHAVNLEAMLHLEPSAIIMASFLAAPVERIGLPVVGVMSAPMEGGILKNARLFADVAGKPMRAMQLGRLLQASFSDVETEVAGVQPHPRVLDLTLSSDGSLRAAGKRGLAHRLLTRAGAQNAIETDMAYVRLSPEQVLDLDPDVIVLNIYSALTPEQFIEQPAWRALAASRHRRVYRQPEGSTLSINGMVETGLYVRWLAAICHPELREGLELRDHIRKAYRTALSLELDENQIDRALSVAANRHMADYQRLLRPPSDRSQ